MVKTAEKQKGQTNTGRSSGILHEDKPLPHDLNLERSILGAMLLDPQPAVDIAVEKFGSTSTFYSPIHQKIYDCIYNLHKKGMGIDLISVSKALSDIGALEEIGGDIYLAEMQNLIATAANIETWCQMLHDMAVLRRLISACTIATEKCYDADKDVGEVLDEVERSILGARELGMKSDLREIKEIIYSSAMPYLEKLSKKDETVAGIPTGFPDLDEIIIGLKPGEMFVLAARPSIGKTALALNIVSNLALHATHPSSVAVFTMEMTAEQIARRLLCSEAGFSEKDFYNKSVSPADWRKVTGAASRLKNAKIYIDPTPGLKVLELRAKARRLKSRSGVNLIVIDYLQLMHADIDKRNETRQLEVAMISSGIKSLAKELNIPILVVAQLNRQAELQSTGRPRLSNLRESGAIEQDADIVAFLHRDRDAHKEATREAQLKGLDAELIIEKNRNGEIGKIDLFFFPITMIFRCKKKEYFNNEDVPEF